MGQVLGIPQVGQQVLQRRPVGPCVDGGQVRGVSGGGKRGGGERAEAEKKNV